MAARDEHEVTSLLRRLDGGDASAADALVRVVQDELHDLAASLMRRQAPDHTLQPTALVNEAWLRLSSNAPEAPRWEDRRHFFKAAARAMRSVLVDHARRKSARKRDASRTRVSFDDVIASYESLSIDVLALDEGIDRLHRIDAQLGQVVELRFFAGLTVEETAHVLGVSVPTVERGWRTARALLHLHLAGGGEPFDGR